ncbi:MAG: nucleotidyltransferase family protein [Rhodobacteraceae bacterium]|nr:nucleotidyltransferase family protein [Paracoccaceae bacterium]
MRNAPRALMIFAAGFGTRMGALTATRPKPLIEVAGRALLDHALALAEGQGLDRIVVNAHYLAEQVAAHLAGRAGVSVAVERPEILDTGGGLRAALPLLGPGPVFTLNSDAVWTGPNPLATLRAAWDPARMDALLLLLPRERAAGHAGPGDFVRAAGGALARGPGLVYSGAQIVNPGRLAAVPDRAFSLNRLWDALIPEGRLHGVVHPGGWCDVGRPESIPLAEALLAEADDVRA